MRLLTTLSAAIMVLPFCLSDAARAQTPSGPAATGGEVKMGDATYFVAQKVWLAKWDIPVIGTTFVPPSPSSPVPLIRTTNQRVDPDHAIPLTSLGVRIDRWSLSATLSPSTSFSDSRVAGGALSRSEYDVNVGYALTPNVAAALVYKGGKNTIRGLAAGDTPELFNGVTQKLSGWGAGMNLTASITDTLGAYSTFAYVRGRATTNADDERLHPKYALLEAGVAYRIPAGFGGFSVQAGYRYQNIKFKDGPIATYALTPAPVVVALSVETLRSITKGFVIGASVSF